MHFDQRTQTALRAFGLTMGEIAEFPEHDLEGIDLYTHGADLRGYIDFGEWGAYVEDGRALSEAVVELTLGPTVHDRVRFAADRDAL